MKLMTEPQTKRWESGTWRGAEQSRREADRRLTFRQKLEWNAQALKFAEQLKLGKQTEASRAVRSS